VKRKGKRLNENPKKCALKKEPKRKLGKSVGNKLGMGRVAI